MTFFQLELKTAAYYTCTFLSEMTVEKVGVQLFFDAFWPFLFALTSISICKLSCVTQFSKVRKRNKARSRNSDNAIPFDFMVNK